MLGAPKWASKEVATNNYWAQENLWDNMCDGKEKHHGLS